MLLALRVYWPLVTISAGSNFENLAGVGAPSGATKYESLATPAAARGSGYESLTTPVTTFGSRYESLNGPGRTLQSWFESLSGPAGIKASSYEAIATIAGLLGTNYESFVSVVPPTVQGTSSRFESLTAPTGSTQTRFESLAGPGKAVASIYEVLAGRTGPLVTSYESLKKVTRISDTNCIEILKGLSPSKSSTFEALGIIQSSAPSTRFESLALPSGARIALYESLSGILDQRSSIFESLSGPSGSRLQPFEILAGPASGRPSKFESLVGPAGIRSTSYESLAGRIVGFGTGFESLSRPSVITSSPFESLRSAGLSFASKYEVLAGPTSALATWYESLTQPGVVFRQLLTYYESIAVPISIRPSSFESLVGSSAARLALYESLVGPSRSPLSFFESLAIIATHQASPLEVVHGIARQIATQFASLASAISAIPTKFEALARTGFLAPSYYESLAPAFAPYFTEVEALVSLANPFHTSFEATSTMPISLTPGPPTVVATSPVNNSIGVVLGTPISVTFNQAVDPTTVSSQTFSLFGPGQADMVTTKAMLFNLAGTYQGMEYVDGTFSFSLLNIISPPSSGPTLGQVVGTSNYSGTYYVRMTYATANGETPASPESSFTLTANQLLTATYPPSVPGTIGWNIYVSTTPGAGTRQNLAPLSFGPGWQMPSSGLIVGAPVPPLAPVAYYTNGGTLPALTYYVQVAYISPLYGQSLASPEVAVVVPANSLLTVNSPAPPAGVTGYNVYVGLKSGAEVVQNTLAPVPIGLQWSLPVSGILQTGTPAPPSNSTGQTVMAFSPSVPLRPNVQYTALVAGASTLLSTQEIKNLAGMAMVNNYQFQFTTGTLNLLAPPVESPIAFTSAIDPATIRVVALNANGDRFTNVPYSVPAAQGGGYIGPNPANDDLAALQFIFPANIDTTTVTPDQILASIDSILQDPGVQLPIGVTPTVTILNNTITINWSGLVFP